ncbi:MAG: Fic family protein [Crocinitomicaceae bacterium]|nr:Fic family protein [Crocinitomicaceae bacterium]
MSRVVSGQRKLQAQQVAKLAKYLSLPLADVQAYFLSIEVQKLLAPYPKLVQQVFKLTEERMVNLRSHKVASHFPIPAQFDTQLAALTRLQQQWQDLKPLGAAQILKLKSFFHTAYTYESNRIEGNTLSLQETHLVVNEGITIGGKTMREHLEAINHQEAIDFIEGLVQNTAVLNKEILLQIHQLVLKGIQHEPPSPLLLDELMEGYFDFYERNKRHLHPVILATEMHERLVSIHPFIDGNGRTARLVMNLILLQNGYTIVNLKGNPKNRLKYYQALEQIQLNHAHTDFYQLILSAAEKSLKMHLEMGG